MLQADEIIQQKEWQQLDASEKAIVAELADNEAEYNFLRKMLLVSAEDATDVPQVDAAVYQKIKTTLPAVKRSSSLNTWYAAAASIIAITIAAFFILQKEKKVDVAAIPVVKETIKIPLNDSLPIQKDNAPVLVQKEEKVHQPKRSIPQTKPVFPSLKDTVQNNYAVLNISVSKDPSLLDFVTEVE